MNTYHGVLFIHLLGLLVATGAATVTHLAHLWLRRATTLADAARWATTMKHASQAFPLAVVLLLGSGAYMVADVWSWSLPWVLAALAGLAAIVLVGDAVMGRYGRALGGAIGEAIGRGGDGPVTEEVRRLLDNRFVVSASFVPTLLMLGIVYVMTAKPGAAGSAAALLVAVGVAAAAGPALVREAAPQEVGTAVGAADG